MSNFWLKIGHEAFFVHFSNIRIRRIKNSTFDEGSIEQKKHLIMLAI